MLQTLGAPTLASAESREEQYSTQEIKPQTIEMA